MRDESLSHTMLTTDELPEEAELEASLRPRQLDEFVGQAKLKERLNILIESAQERSDPLDHVLFSGPPGLGKTTLAGIVAHELNTRLRATSGPALERPGDIAAILTNLEPADVFFIDEIHRTPRAVEEVLYAAMEDFHLDIVLGKGASARSIRLDLPPFTLIGATTRVGNVAAALRDRFGFLDRLDYYTAEELEAIVRRSASILERELKDDGARVISTRSRGTPRVANRLLRRVRDYAVARADGIVDRQNAEDALDVFEVDSIGLDKVDVGILRAVVEKFDGGPVGLSTLAIAVGEEPETVEDAYEPYLLQQGLLKRTPRGRVATSTAYEHLGVEPTSQQTLL